MAKRYITVEATARTSAPPEVVWEALADSRSWPTWSPNDEAALEREGAPTADGLGAIRRFRTGRIVVREEIVAFEPVDRVAYRLLSGLPVRDYTGEVTLAPMDPGTRITWRSTFRASVPGLGPLLRRRLREVVRDFSSALAKHADTVDASAR